MDLFDLFVTVGFKDEASDNVSNLSSKLQNGLKTAAKIGATAVTAAAAGVAALTKGAIENYAEYEQLVGGVETLFKNSADTVQQYAANAYKTAGLSANEYMNTVTSFSASLLQSLGGDTQAAADYADMAITDMSDNANKMGTDMAMIQNAYQGFAKQNYTMLDNLKLGYGGTKTEMERLLADATAISGIKYDISSYADVVEAIHVIQEEMGIAGTTAKEANETISGSIASAKSAWENLLTGVADDNADFGQLVDNFVESVGVAANNIIPRIDTALQGAGKLVEELVPVLMDKIPVLINSTLPSLIQSGLNIVLALVQGITQNLPSLVTMGVEMLLMVIDGLIEAIPQLIDALPEVITAIVVTLGDNAPKIMQSGVKLIAALIDGLVRSIPTILNNLPQIIKAIVNGLMSYIGAVAEVGKNIVKGLWEGIKSMASWIGDKVSGFFGNIVDNVKEFLGIHSPSRVFAGIGEFMAEGLGDGWNSEFDSIRKGIENGLNFETTANVTASATGSAMPAAAAAAITIPITLELDGALLARKIYSYNQAEIERHGISFVR